MLLISTDHYYDLSPYQYTNSQKLNYLGSLNNANFVKFVFIVYYSDEHHAEILYKLCVPICEIYN